MVKKNIGIEAVQPAKECTDPKCPWHGQLSLRGRVFVGKVVSDKAPKTAVVKWEHYHFIPKYEAYEKRNTRIVVYNPICIDAKKGDMVKVSECRPLSKTKSFCIIEVVKGELK